LQEFQNFDGLEFCTGFEFLKGQINPLEKKYIYQIYRKNPSGGAITSIIEIHVFMLATISVYGNHTPGLLFLKALFVIN